MINYVFGNREKTLFLVHRSYSNGDDSWGIDGSLDKAHKFETEDAAVAFFYRCKKDPYYASSYPSDWMKNARLYKVESKITEIDV